MSLGFLDLPEDGLDPVEASARVARSITAAMDDLKDRGIVDYLSVSGSEEEFDARLASRDCATIVAEVAEKHLASFENPTETLVGHLKATTEKKAHDLNPFKDDADFPWNPPHNPKPVKPWDKKEEDNKPYIKPHPDCEVCNGKKGVGKDWDDVGRKDWEPVYNPNDKSREAAKVAFNPSEDTYLLEPKCQVDGCDKDAEQGGVCAEHSMKKNVAHTQQVECGTCNGTGECDGCTPEAWCGHCDERGRCSQCDGDGVVTRTINN